jgi:hypothetical protein
MPKRASIRNKSPDSIPVPDQLTIRFVRMLPSEEVVYFARRCALKCAISGPLTIAVEASGSAGPGGGAGGSAGERADAVYEVRVERDGRLVVSERDPDILLAVRNAFDRLAISCVELPPAHVIAPANSTDQGPKYWC